MSQKTNPLSLRLQNNQNFLSPWFSDFFFSESYHQQFEIEKYINKLLEEIQYSKAFFSSKNSYRKSNIFLIIQDTRGQLKEKQLSFNLKQSLSLSKPSTLSFLQKMKKDRANQLILLNREQEIIKGYKNGLPPMGRNLFPQDKITKPIKVKENKNIKLDLVSSFRKKIRDNYLKFKQNHNSLALFYSENYLNFFVEKVNATFTVGSGVGDEDKLFLGSSNDNFYRSENDLKSLWKTKWKNKAITNNCLSFCEKIVSTGAVAFSEPSPKAIATATVKENGFKICNIASFLTRTTYFEPIRFISEAQNVKTLLDGVVILLEKRISFRQIKSKLFQNLANNPLIKGIRISCSGRLGGRSKKAQKAKLQSDQWGETSLNAFSSKVLFASKSASTSYGKVGIKIWLSFKEDMI